MERTLTDIMDNIGFSVEDNSKIKTVRLAEDNGTPIQYQVVTFIAEGRKKVFAEIRSNNSKYNALVTIENVAQLINKGYITNCIVDNKSGRVRAFTRRIEDEQLIKPGITQLKSGETIDEKIVSDIADKYVYITKLLDTDIDNISSRPYRVNGVVYDLGCNIIGYIVENEFDKRIISMGELNDWVNNKKVKWSPKSEQKNARLAEDYVLMENSVKQQIIDKKLIAESEFQKSNGSARLCVSKITPEICRILFGEKSTVFAILKPEKCHSFIDFYKKSRIDKAVSIKPIYIDSQIYVMSTLDEFTVDEVIEFIEKYFDKLHTGKYSESLVKDNCLIRYISALLDFDDDIVDLDNTPKVGNKTEDEIIATLRHFLYRRTLGENIDNEFNKLGIKITVSEGTDNLEGKVKVKTATFDEALHTFDIDPYEFAACRSIDVDEVCLDTELDIETIGISYITSNALIKAVVNRKEDTVYLVLRDELRTNKHEILLENTVIPYERYLSSGFNKQELTGTIRRVLAMLHCKDKKVAEILDELNQEY